MIDIFLLNITKYSTGRLRPHFLDVCRSSVNTSTISQCGDAATYVEHYMCLGRDEKRITDARLSFFSGHTSHSFYWAMFFSVSILLECFSMLNFCFSSAALSSCSHWSNLSNFCSFSCSIYFTLWISSICWIFKNIR